MALDADNIFLVGPMGAGKSTIGKVLSELVDMEFVDSDREIEKSTGADISWIFDMEGEQGFRVREERMIDELSQRRNIVLATGGGAVLAAANRYSLQQRGVVVYLRTTIEQQIERTSRDTKRPLLQTADPAQTIRELMAKREALYLEVADIIVDTWQKTSRIVSMEISQQLPNRIQCRSAQNDIPGNNRESEKNQ